MCLQKNHSKENDGLYMRVSNDTSNSTLYRGILISICQKYGINLKYTDSNDELKEKIKGIKY